MATCPACGAKSEADFGMVTCSSCETVFMVEIDGSVGVPGADDDQIVEQASYDEGHEGAAVASDMEFQPLEDEADTSSSESTTTDEVTTFDSQEGLHPEPEDEDQMYAAAAPEGAEPTEVEPETEYSEDFLDTLDGDNTAVEIDEKKDPLGVTHFDGSQASQLADGPYYYDLTVSGIDTAHLKQQVVDALMDKRLNWSPEEIKKKIKMGQLQLLSLNPVRAVLAVLKLQSLDVDVSWTQRLFTSEANPRKDQET